MSKHAKLIEVVFIGRIQQKIIRWEGVSKISPGNIYYDNHSKLSKDQNERHKKNAQQGNLLERLYIYFN